jgi:hypothetical protein
MGNAPGTGGTGGAGGACTPSGNGTGTGAGTGTTGGALGGATGAAGTINFNTSNIRKLSGWLAWLALLACIIGIFISASLWALGSKGQNPGQELTGKKGMILCCTAAFFVGAMPNLLNWLEGAAHQADTTGVTGSVAGGTGAGLGGAVGGAVGGGSGLGGAVGGAVGGGTGVGAGAGGATGGGTGVGTGAGGANSGSTGGAIGNAVGIAAPHRTNADGTIQGCPGIKNIYAGTGRTVNIPGCGVVVG